MPLPILPSISFNLPDFQRTLSEAMYGFVEMPNDIITRSAMSSVATSIINEGIASEYDKPFKAQDAETKAEEMDLITVFPMKDEIFIDIDSEEDFKIFESHWSVFKHTTINKGTPLKLFTSFVVKPSKSGGKNKPNRHIVVKLGRNIKSNNERIMLQLLFGSDRKREMLSYLSNMDGVDKPTVFFEKKPGPPKVRKVTAKKVKDREAGTGVASSFTTEQIPIPVVTPTRARRPRST